MSTRAGELLRLNAHVPAPLDGDSFFLKYQDNDEEMLAKLMFKDKPANLISGKAQERSRAPRRPSEPSLAAHHPSPAQRGGAVRAPFVHIGSLAAL